MTFWTRAGWEFCTGRPAPPDLFCVYEERPGTRYVVTYAEQMAEKRRSQRERLARMTRVEHWEAWLLSVRWCPGLGDTGFFKGYFVQLDRIGNEPVWVRQLYDVRRLLPLGLLPIESDETWKETFVRTYPKGRRNGHDWGARAIWRRRWEMRLVPKEAAR